MSNAPAMATAARPLLNDELIVNEKIFARCNHRQWMRFGDKFRQELLVCGNCGEKFVYRDDIESGDEPEFKPDEFLQGTVRRYSSEEVLANLTLRQVESGGWRVLLKEVAGQYACELTKGSSVFASRPYKVRTEAVCEAAAMLGRSGLFTPPSSGA